MSAPERPEASRIAIKFGSSSSGSAKKPNRPPPPSSSLGKRSRPSHGLGGNSDSESEDDSRSHGRHERITAFGENGAELARSDRDKRDDRRPAKRGPLTIERQANRDWRSEARSRNQQGHRQLATRSEADRPQAGSQKEVQPVDEDKPLQWGLTLTKKTPPADNDNEKNGHDDKKTPESGRDMPEMGAPGQTPEDHEISTEKEAVRALMGETIDDRTKTRRVIERAANEVTEDDVFNRDFNDAPDVSTLDDYEAMPVEEFGAALLRGMGWDGKDRGPKVKQVVRRPNQMGLGAKELKGDEDLGGWNHKTGGSSNSSHHRQRPPKLHDYRREEDKRREKREERYRDSYKSERDRERDDRGSSGRHRSRNYR
ncbi:DNA primase large subunit Spp2 [Sporothrix bragantina]|uniref:Pre-mRNA-splicing factor n=1 Tax=Sporothrix bragantina TaxID=671064 RepID=A0ABP0C7L1_9PEZI